MKKYLLYLYAVILFVIIVWANLTGKFDSSAYGDQISYSWTPTATDTITGARYKADRNAVKNVVNANITNSNIKSTANIAQSKIDSSSGWISNVVGYFTSGSSFINLRSPYGIRFFSNDSTTYDKEFLFVSDSTDSIAIFSNDSVSFKKKVNASNLFSTTNKGDSMIANIGARITNTLTSDRLKAGTTANNPAWKLYTYQHIVTTGDTTNPYQGTVPRIAITPVVMTKVYGLLAIVKNGGAVYSQGSDQINGAEAYLMSTDSVYVDYGTSIVAGDTVNVSFFEIQ